MSKPVKDIVIGVDIGGTKIMAGAIDAGGKVVSEPVSVPTGGNDEKEIIFSRIAWCIESVIKNAEEGRIKGIGLGATGPLDIEKGLILECPQLPTMHFFPLKERVSGKFRMPVAMDNDANALLLGESIWGAGRGHRVVLGYTLGTGLGCALVIDNKLFTGTNGMACEIWPSPDGEAIIEETISGNGVSKIYSSLSGKLVSSAEVADLARRGDKYATETWNRFGTKMADAVAWGINFTDPGIVVLGGSIANSLDLFYDAMEARLRKFICPVPASRTKVVKAALGDHSGFIGAAALLFQ